MLIKNVKAFQILDSRGVPTIKCCIELENGIKGNASVPSGSSVGANEAFELRDANSDCYFGKSVIGAIRNINTQIKEAIIERDLNQSELDNLLKELDGTPNKTNLGANAILAVSLAFARASANFLNKPLYQYIKEDLFLNNEEGYEGVIPLVNVINGGKHADNKLAFQEFLLIPLKANKISLAIQMMSEISYQLKLVLKENNENIAKGDEGGYSLINAETPEEVCEFLKTSISRAGYQLGEDVGIGFDVAASSIYDEDKKAYLIKDGDDDDKVYYDSNQMIELYNHLVRDYSVVSIEDPFHENDWENFALFNKEEGNGLQIVGDDLYCTNQLLLAKGIEQRATNAILIKLNQIGTLSETIDVIRLAQLNHINTIISHRSGETEDTFIADLVVGSNALQIKCGGMSRSERIAKYNRLLEIEQEVQLIMPVWKDFVK